MLENINPDIVILILIAATAGALTSVLYGLINRRRIERQRREWEAEDQQRVDVINKHLTGGRDG